VDPAAVNGEHGGVERSVSRAVNEPRSTSLTKKADLNKTTKRWADIWVIVGLTKFGATRNVLKGFLPWKPGGRERKRFR
jgi:hypothetical protein